VITKPTAIQWLEEQTGQRLDYVPEAPPGQDRHMTVRRTGELAAGLEELAADRKLTVSQLVRELLREAVELREEVAALDANALAERLAADVAEVRRRLAV
jgi:hypothetical protein